MKTQWKKNKYLMRFLYAFAGIFVGIFALTPIILGLGGFIGILLLCLTSPWWLLLYFPFFAIALAFGEDFIYFIEEYWDKADDIINYNDYSY